MQRNIKLNRIVRERDFEFQIAEIAENFEMMDLMDSGIDWYLSRSPEAESPIGHGYYVWITEDWWGGLIPPLRILYHHAPEEMLVTLVRVEALPTGRCQ